MTGPGILSRRGIFSAGAGLALGAVPAVGAAAKSGVADGPARMLSAAQFGAVGDGAADDTAALQAALDATFSPGSPGLLSIPPGTYRITRPLRVAADHDITRQSGILGHGARLVSAIANGASVLEITCRATVRFMLIDGLDILGSGREGHGIAIECDRGDKYFYNFCLRDVVVQGCGGDGCRMIGNVFEGQLINSYFRDNNQNGATFGHGTKGGILSAIHVFGCVFGQNKQHGAALINNCYDVSFHGCYLLLNGKFGLSANNGCTLLSNCGFENNHAHAAGFQAGDAGIALNSFGTLIGCTAYSIFNQTMLLRAFITGRLVMIGCSGSGDGGAKAASLAKIGGPVTGSATVIGCTGAVAYGEGLQGSELGGAAGGLRVGSHWQSPVPLRLGEYRLWVDHAGRLRMKNGAPTYDEDGTAVGA